MKLPRPFLLGSLLGAFIFVLAVTPARSAPATTTNAPAATVTNAATLSVFEDNMAAGKDPFFPHSRRRTLDLASTPAGPAPDVTSLVLQGISSTARSPLATINNQTFKAGEDGEVVTSAGRMRIRVEEIRGDSVTVSIGAQRMELRMPQR